MAAAPFVHVSDFTTREAMPVKNTFINFEDSSPTCGAPLVRAASCPAWVWPCCCVEGAATWEGATQALCHAMAPRIQLDVDARFTPDSSPRTASAVAGSCNSCPKCEESDDAVGSSFVAASVSQLVNQDEPDVIVADAWDPKTDRNEHQEEDDTADSETPTGCTTTTSDAASDDWTEVRAGRKNLKARRAQPPLRTCEPRQQVMRTASDIKRLTPKPYPPPYPQFPAPVARRSELKQLTSSAPLQQLMHVRQSEVLKEKSKCITHKFDVGIEADCGFQVVKRLIGTTGSNMKRIVDKSMGAKVWVCCRDSRLPDGGEWVESMGPLMICVSAMAGPGFDIAVERVQELLDIVRLEHHEFCRDAMAKEAPA